MRSRGAGVLWCACVLGLAGASIVLGQSPLPNPDFDAPSVAGWAPMFGATVAWSEFEPECSPPYPGGSLGIVPASGAETYDFGTSFCSDVVPSGSVALRFLARTADRPGMVGGSLEYFDQTGCQGTSLGVNHALVGQNQAAWESYGTFAEAVPGGAASFRVALLAIPLSQDYLPGMYFDRLEVGSSVLISRSGFEAGGYCHWTSTAP